LIKVMKSFANQRIEITGLKIKFRGRINRWRRTKSIVGTTRHIAFQTMDSRIEYGTAKAINKKGAIGIRLWIAYASYFEDLLKTTFISYFTYSKDLYTKQLKQSLFPIAHLKSK
jgi:ribosomal protein S3